MLCYRLSSLVVLFILLFLPTLSLAELPPAPKAFNQLFFTVEELGKYLNDEDYSKVKNTFDQIDLYTAGTVEALSAATDIGSLKVFQDEIVRLKNSYLVQSTMLNMVTFFSAREQLFVMAEQFTFDPRRFRTILADYVDSIDECLHNGEFGDLCRRMIETTAFLVKQKGELIQAGLSEKSFQALLNQLQNMNKIAGYRIVEKIVPEIDLFKEMIAGAMKEMQA